MLLTEQGDKVFFDRKDDMFEMHILPKDQMEEDGKPIQDVMQFGLKPTSAKKAFNRLKRKQRYKTSDGETSVWLADNKLNFKFDAPYFPQSFQVSFGYFLSAQIMAWFGSYSGSVTPQVQTLPQKVGRNDSCPCGSGKKYKKCCLALGHQVELPETNLIDSSNLLGADPAKLKIPADLQSFVIDLGVDQVFDLIQLATDYPPVKKDAEFWLCLASSSSLSEKVTEEEMVTYYQKAMELKSDCIEARFQLASIYYSQREFQLASEVLPLINTFDVDIPTDLEPFALIDDTPTQINVYVGVNDDTSLVDASYWVELGSAVGSSGDHDLALVAFNKAIAIKPDDYTANVNIAVTYGILGETDEALHLVDEVLANYSPAKLSNTHRPPYVIKANILHQLEQYLEAIPLYEKAIAAEPDFFLPYVRLIDSLEKTDHPLLEYWLEKAIHNVPNSAELAITYCRFLYKHNRLIELSQAEWIESIDPEDGRLDIVGRNENNPRLALESHLYRNIGQYLDSADQSFLLKGVELIEDAEWHLCDLAKELYLFCAQSGLTEQAQISYSRVCDDCRQNDASLPQHPETIAALGHMSDEEFEIAVPIFEQVLQNDPDCLHSLLGYWWSLDEVGRVKEALEVAKKAYHHPLFDSYPVGQELPIANLAYNIGWLSGKVGQLGQAAHYYQQQLERDSAHAFSLENLSFIHLLQQDLDSAQHLFNQSFQCREREIREQIDELNLEQGVDVFFNIAEYEEFKAAKQSRFDVLMSVAEKYLGTSNFTGDLMELNNQGDYQIGAYTAMPESRFDLGALLEMIRTNPHDKGEIDNVTFQVEMEGRGDYSILVQPIKERIGNFDILPIEARGSIIEAEYRLTSSDKLIDYAPVIVSYAKSFEICLYQLVFKSFRRFCQQKRDLEQLLAPIFDYNTQQTRKVRGFAYFLKEGRHLALDAMHMVLNFCNGTTATRQEIVGDFREFVCQRLQRERLLDGLVLDQIEELKGYRNPAAHSQSFTLDQANKVQDIVLELMTIF